MLPAVPARVKLKAVPTGALGITVVVIVGAANSKGITVSNIVGANRVNTNL